MLPNRLWVAEVSELFVIVAKNSVCIVAKKDEKKDFKQMKQKKGTRKKNFQKEKKNEN